MVKIYARSCLHSIRLRSLIFYMHLVKISVLKIVHASFSKSSCLHHQTSSRFLILSCLSFEIRTSAKNGQVTDDRISFGCLPGRSWMSTASTPPRISGMVFCSWGGCRQWRFWLQRCPSKSSKLDRPCNISPANTVSLSIMSANSCFGLVP